MNSGLAIIGLTLLLVAAVSRRLSSTPVTPAMVVTAIGVLAGPLVLDDLSARPTSSTVRTLAEATLAVVLFSDSSRVDLRALRREASMPVRLLGVGLPLTVVLGGLVAVLLFGSFSLSEAVILGVILAPTDAGLGSAVVTDSRLPQVVRQSLNVESGLNDGICVPLLLISLATVSGAGGESHPLRVVAEQIGYGLLGGVAAGVLAAVVVNMAEGRHLIDDAWRQIIPVAAAVLAYGIAVDLGGSGFIAAFVAGSLFGLIARENLASMMRFTEETGSALDSVTFLVFGAVLLGPVLEHVSWQIALYAVLSLTIVRMLPVAISLLGHPRAGSDGGVHGLVRPPRARIDRVRGDGRGRSSRSRRNDRRGHLPDRRPLGARARTLGSAAGESLRQLVPNRRGQAPPCDGEPTDARAPNPWARHAAEQLTVEHRPRRRCYRSSSTPAARSQRPSPKGLKLKSASASRFQSSDLDDWNPGSFGDHPSRRVHNSCRFKDTQISRITTCRGPGKC